MNHRREKIHINGIVQGVGFRPFVYRLAQECQLTGFVHNSGNGVLIEVQGQPGNLQQFRERLRKESPPLARIVDVQVTDIDNVRESEFKIRASDKNSSPQTLISPDISVCADCLRELFDPQDRRYGYPFINCTNCGPRYTIVESIPYDRPYTSMRVFPMCDDCEQEYHDPGNRRFHAQPNACPECGPKLTLCEQSGEEIATDDPIAEAVRLLQAGKIVAVRGVGGFHLAVDAFNDEAVRLLRQRKGRAQKPLAMMAPDLTSIKRFCLVSPEEAVALRQPTRPIVLLKAQPEHTIASSVAGNNKYLGFMLPYTPLHYLLLSGNFEALVMTSGNISEEPIAISNEEALRRLANLADYFLLHDREILQRCDDSIVRIVANDMQLTRRSRGYVPAPVFLSEPTRKRILACGGELKNTIALSRDDTVFLSQHIGDLDNPAALAFFENSIAHLQDILQIKPEVIAYDLHPEYLSTKWALAQDDLPKIGVQHHHAHLASVMAENGVAENTIGIILDGTGYGTDGTIWGGEILIGDFREFERFAWLKPAPLPGGAAAIQQPWRMALSYLYQIYGEQFLELDLPFLRRMNATQVSLILQMTDKGLNSPLTSSCGRLFDAVSALLDIRGEINYEAQAAIELEMLAFDSLKEHYEVAVPYGRTSGSISVAPLFKALVEDICTGQPVALISAKFHRTLAEMFVRTAMHARIVSGINQVGLSGGVFQNMTFLGTILKRLQEEGFEVLTHKQVPTNDGGLALGQIVIANALL